MGRHQAMDAYDPAIRCRGLRVVRAGRSVLPGFDLDVPAGQLVGLLGPSGCGKSTLMRSVVGAQRVAGGQVTVLGLPAGHPRLRSRVGYLTQSVSVYDDLTVTENLKYFAAVVAAPDGDVARVLRDVDLAARGSSLVSQLSGGERARVSLAVALLGRPELLVLDEPTVGLDPVLRRDLWRLFRSLAEGGVDPAGLQPRHGRGPPGATGWSCCTRDACSRTAPCPSCWSAPGRATPTRRSWLLFVQVGAV